ncbi:hypothetical protein BKA62DRAFT_716784 [Auriculariales sp. MPI-PUGE-AT-0066]|nr:hypothetical protein BKA62DRAFT_716784 [Auriculariales sp. MPI-PUGE-AT-0066]
MPGCPPCTQLTLSHGIVCRLGQLMRAPGGAPVPAVFPLLSPHAMQWRSDLVRFLSGRTFGAYILMAHAMRACTFHHQPGFDWDVARGRRKFNIATLFYLLPRYSSLMVSIVALRITNVFSANVDCQVRRSHGYMLLHCFSYGTVGLTSGLLYARVCALSARNIFVIIGIGLAYLGYWVLVVYAIYHCSKGVYVQQLLACSAEDLHTHRITTIYMFGFDLLCLSAVLVCLLRMHRGGSLWSYLLKQGILYFICICVAYLCSVVFHILDLNDAVSEAPNTVAVFVTTVCATRMQRGLIEYFDSPVRGYQLTLGGHSVTNPFDRSKANHPTRSVGPVQVDRTMHVHVHGDDAFERGDAYALDKFEEANRARALGRSSVDVARDEGDRV